MRAHVGFGVLLLAGSVAFASSPQQGRVYLVTWAAVVDASPERRALMKECDRQLRDELHRRGAQVTDRPDARTAIVLRPNLHVLPKGLRLEMVGMRNADKKLLGSVSVKAGGASREKQLRALVKHVCSEADEF